MANIEAHSGEYHYRSVLYTFSEGCNLSHNIIGVEAYDIQGSSQPWNRNNSYSLLSESSSASRIACNVLYLGKQCNVS